MMFRVFASEGLRTLNYAPGPMDTAMQSDIRCNLVDLNTRNIFDSMNTEARLVPSAVSAAKMARIVLQDTFVSGAHLDFYDED